MKKLVITTAPEISEATFSYICEGFRTMLGEAEIVHETDTSLIGGFTAACDGKFYDLSMKTQLAKLTEYIESGVGE